MRARRYVIEFGGAMVAYGVLLFASQWAVQAFGAMEALRTALLLAPMLGLLAAVRAVVRHHRRVDELQRQILFEGYAIAFAGTAVATFGWGFLELAGLPRLPTFAIWPLMCVLMCAGLVIAQWRYR